MSQIIILRCKDGTVSVDKLTLLRMDFFRGFIDFVEGSIGDTEQQCSGEMNENNIMILDIPMIGKDDIGFLVMYLKREALESMSTTKDNVTTLLVHAFNDFKTFSQYTTSFEKQLFQFIKILHYMGDYRYDLCFPAFVEYLGKCKQNRFNRIDFINR